MPYRMWVGLLGLCTGLLAFGAPTAAKRPAPRSAARRSPPPRGNSPSNRQQARPAPHGARGATQGGPGASFTLYRWVALGLLWGDTAIGFPGGLVKKNSAAAAKPMNSDNRKTDW